MKRPPFTFVILLLGIAIVQSACVSVDVKLANFMSADRGPRTAVLARGYAVQDLVIHRGERAIGVTHAHQAQSRTLIVFCGGDSFHRSIEGGEALEALARDADVMLFDYPGYGDTTGTPTAAGILETALAVYDYAAALQTSSGKKRVIYGFSLGGLVAAQVAGARPIDGLILEATAPNVARWANSQIPWYAKPLIKPRIEAGLASVDAITALQRFRGEVLVLSSRADRQAPAALSTSMHRQLLHAGVSSQQVQFADAAHGAIPNETGYTPALQGFLARLQVRP